MYDFNRLTILRLTKNDLVQVSKEKQINRISIKDFNARMKQRAVYNSIVVFDSGAFIKILKDETNCLPTKVIEGNWNEYYNTAQKIYVDSLKNNYIVAVRNEGRINQHKVEHFSAKCALRQVMFKHYKCGYDFELGWNGKKIKSIEQLIDIYKQHYRIESSVLKID